MPREQTLTPVTSLTREWSTVTIQQTGTASVAQQVLSGTWRCWRKSRARSSLSTTTWLTLEVPCTRLRRPGNAEFRSGFSLTGLPRYGVDGDGDVDVDAVGDVDVDAEDDVDVDGESDDGVDADGGL